eukprot:3852676-Amphidinium_carterae.1
MEAPIDYCHLLGHTEKHMDRKSRTTKQHARHANDSPKESRFCGITMAVATLQCTMSLQFKD